MNYLAHALLSGNDEELIIGNFIADHVRNNELAGYSPGILKGILFHREIDSFTDSHPDFRAAKRFFYPEFEKHSGILIDIYFDHLLASGFDAFSNESLHNFSERVYKVYEQNRRNIPQGAQRFLDYLLRDRIYQAYASEEGIERVLFHLSNRIRHSVRLDRSLPLFLSHKSELESCFRRFFEEARNLYPGKAGMSLSAQDEH
jgi:acyl carrier protein phosphodiesterase